MSSQLPDGQSCEAACETNTDGTTRPYSSVQIPSTVQIGEVISNRYGVAPKQGEAEFALNRPLEWGARKEGIDVVLTLCGSTIPLRSSGAQSVPQAGWKVYLTGGNPGDGYTWTLYGIPPVS